MDAKECVNAMALSKLKKSAKISKKSSSTKKDKKLISKQGKKKSSGGGEVEGLISKGYKAVRENAKRIELAKEQAGKRIYRTWIPDGESKTYRFLHEEPLTFDEHRVSNPNGRPDFFTCLGEDCPLCAIADGKRIGKRRFVGMFLVIERDEYTPQSGPNKGKTFKNQPRLLVEGQTVLAQCEYFSEKRGLSNRDYTIMRSDRTRTFDAEEKSPLSKEDKKTIKELLEKHGVDTIDELLYEQVKLQTLSAEDLEERFGIDSYDDTSSKLRDF